MRYHYGSDNGSENCLYQTAKVETSFPPSHQDLRCSKFELADVCVWVELMRVALPPRISTLVRRQTQI
ncbi:MAG: hypothetical protein EBT42_03950 [Actinobacteria bacterium]|nr:hypothetical protein [Actinomycetota bacterium]